jgi:hypothetical protein
VEPVLCGACQKANLKQTPHGTNTLCEPILMRNGLFGQTAGRGLDLPPPGGGLEAPPDRASFSADTCSHDTEAEGVSAIDAKAHHVAPHNCGLQCGGVAGARGCQSLRATSSSTHHGAARATTAAAETCAAVRSPLFDALVRVLRW